MVDKKTRRSRRAKRREEQETAGSSEAEETAEATDGDSAEAGEQAEAEGAEAEEAEAGEQAEAEESDSPAEQEEAAAAEEPEAEEKPARPRAPKKKKKKKKKGAGSPNRPRDRNERIRERAAARRRERDAGLAAGEMVDDALARSTQAATNWIKDHFNVVQWVIIVLIVGGVGWEIYSWHHNKLMEKASDKLITAVVDENAKLPGGDESGQEAQFDTRKTFPSADARDQAAEKSYKAAEKVAKGSGASILAALGLAGVQYDQNKFAAAQKNYESVKDSELAKHDTDVKGRALEGIGMCLEAENKLDAADKAYREMENMEVPGLESLALYHQARIAFLKGDKTKATKLLKKVESKLEDTDSPYPQNSYLATMTRELMVTINPSAAPPPRRQGMQLTAAQIEKLKEQIKKNPAKLKELMKSMGLKLPPPVKAPPAPPPTSGKTSSTPSGGSRAPATKPKGKSTSASAPATAPKSKPKPAPHPAPAGSAP